VSRWGISLSPGVGASIALASALALVAQERGPSSWSEVEQATSVEALRRFRGDFGGIRLDVIKPQCPVDLQTDIRCPPNAHGLANGALFTPAYPVYTSAQRAAIRAAYKARGYTHFPIGIYTERRRSYHDVYPPGPKGGDVSPISKSCGLTASFPSVS